ncbi:RES family NAD+ phosphorylase [Bradyrhizobium neotropicale]|uniref:RES family NAD+ phosphorylase n=1 Tax=Bradyrhizobium neotropicale TaxID=1497615 RepID=UPI001AD6B198|nr:RES family NAD+ phosphorylase [Bradyrhizobium neotropicale]MBO4226871.1 RES domain-containing protein [Bradyrhizobium neotropicale]
MTQGTDWRNFGNSLKAETRFFNRTAANDLASIFEGIGELQTRDGRPLVVDAGPGTNFHTLYRARAFRSDERLEAALGRPDVHLGAPPAPFAATGRNSSVFYGASNQKAAIVEVRPPLGSQIAVAQFEIIRKLRLLDLTALSDVRVTESLADFGLAGRMEGAVFLRLLSGRIVRPVMSDDDPLECLATQAIADFLATEASVPIDGIISPSVQAVGNDLYVVLFHKAARVEALSVPEGTEISASTGYWAEDGWVEDYEVVEKIAPLHKEVQKSEREPERLDFTAIAEAMPLDPRDVDWREASLRIVPESIEVHRVKRVEFATEEFTVKRQRREKRGSINL